MQAGLVDDVGCMFPALKDWRIHISRLGVDDHFRKEKKETCVKGIKIKTASGDIVEEACRNRQLKEILFC